MTGNTRNSGRRPALAIFTLGFAALVLQGCAGGAVTGSVYATSGAAAAALHQKRQEFRENLNEDYTSYRELLSSSDCKPEQYRVSPEIRDYVKASARALTEDAYTETQDVLMETYQDQTLSRDVRAHALYVAALAEAQEKGGSDARAREYLKRVKQEFPGTHDCAVEKLLEKGDRIQ